ncbi:MAG: hypothetical protein ABIE07_12105 [Candidatus Zixiibacteriota bacterium]
MSFTCQSRFLLLAVAVLMAVMVFSTESSQAQMPEIYLALSDTTVAAGDTTGWVSVWFTNYQETLAAFTIKIVLNNPDLVDFRTDAVDTSYRTTTQYCAEWDQGTCVDWRDTLIIDTIVNSGALDTAGCLISGWEYVTARSVSENRTDIKVTAIADAIGQPYVPGVAPRTNPGVLFRLRMRAKSEVIDSSDNVVGLLIIDNLSETMFSDPHGDLFGVITNYTICDSTWIDEVLVCDTFYRYWICQDWNGSDCLDWINTTNPDSAIFADSTSIDSIPWTVRNESTCFYDDGDVTVNFADCLCGDANGDTFFNIGDPVYLINHIFKYGPPPVTDCGGTNGDPFLNVGDVVYGINTVFKGGPDPICN